MSDSESLSSDNSDNENFSNDFIKNILDDSEIKHLKGRPSDTARFKGSLETSNNVNKTHKCDYAMKVNIIILHV